MTMRSLPVFLLIGLFTLVGCTPPAPAAPATTPPAAEPATPITQTVATAAPTDVMTATVTMTETSAPSDIPAITVTTTITAPTSGEVGDCNWTAIHDFQPPGPPQLRVNGVCIMPTPGYTLTLTRAEPQGINPNILLLNLMTEAPTGIVAQVLTPTEVVYEEDTDQQFDQVTILSEGGAPEGETVDVQEVE